MTPLEGIGFGHRQTSEEDSGSGQSTIIDTRHPFFATQPQEESGDEDHKGETNHRKKDEPDDRAELLMISLNASISTRDGVFGRDNRCFALSRRSDADNPAPISRIGAIQRFPPLQS
jgi:hypothetical protein